MSGRRLFLLLALLGAALLSLLVASFGPDRTWSLWNIPTMHPCFADARSITAGAESYRDGYDPLTASPSDPWRRPMNYPRLWQELFRLGLDQRSTVALGLVMIAAFLAGLLLFVDRIDHATAWLLALALFSPAVLLGIERANVSLLIFFLCAGALVALRRSAVAAALLLTAAGVLMYFPVFGLLCLARARRRLFLGLAGASLAVCAVVVALTWDDVRLIARGAERGTFESYGLNVGWMAARDGLHSGVASALVASVCAVLLLGAFGALVHSVRAGLAPADARHPQHLDGFLLGAAVYAGTFLLGNNWDYRMMFLLFCVPQLVDWSRDHQSAVARAARVTLLALLASLWMQFFFRFAHHLPGGGYLMLAIDEAANWLLLGGLLYLLPAALPSWMRRRPAGSAMITAAGAA